MSSEALEVPASRDTLSDVWRFLRVAGAPRFSVKRVVVSLSIVLFSAVLTLALELQARGLVWYEALAIAPLFVLLPLRLALLAAFPLLFITALSFMLLALHVDPDFFLVIVLEFLHENNALASLGIFAVVGVIGAWGYGIYSAQRQILRRRWAIVICGLVCAVVTGVAWAANNVLEKHAFLSISHGLWRGFSTVAPLFSVNRVEPLKPSQSALGHYMASNKRAPRVLLMLVESGDLNPILHNATLRSFLEAQKGRVEVLDAGAVPFHGSTIHGEFRELCGVRLVSLDQHRPPDCAYLREFAKEGYATSAWHAYTGSFYRRKLWWPAIGFEGASHFAPSGPGRVGCTRYFRGPCDDTMIDDVVTWLANEERGFAYLLTLDTHFPLEDKDLMRPTTVTPARCEDDATACQIGLHVAALVEHLSKQATSAGIDLDLIMVGDHAYPLRGYPTRGEVGYTILRLHAGEHAASHARLQTVRAKYPE